MAKPLEREKLTQQLDQLFVATALQREQLQLSETRQQSHDSPFGNNPPEAVVFTSNSLRKALMLYWSLIGEYDLHDWPDFMGKIIHNPEELGDARSVVGYFEKHIHNGDGFVREPFLIGYLPDGIPLYLCPTDGESKDNADPLKEARNKILDVLPHLQGRDLIFFSSDAVQDIRTSKGKLGKPINRDGYETAVEQGPEAVEIFKSEYLETFYTSPDDKPLLDQHVTGLVVMRGKQMYEEVIVLSVEVQEWLLQFVEVHLQMGGGGVFQQFLWLLEAQEQEIWLHLQNEDLTKYLRGVEKEQWSFDVIFHIMGVPAWKILAALKEVSPQLPESEFA